MLATDEIYFPLSQAISHSGNLGFQTGTILSPSLGLNITLWADPSIKGHFDRRIGQLGTMLVQS